MSFSRIAFPLVAFLSIGHAQSQSSSSARAPYSSATIPGIIQAENYDLGGEGIAYHDDDPFINQGSVYRQDGVDIAPTPSNDGYAVGWTVTGEWLEYTVTVSTAGTYTWSARVSSGANGSSFRVYLGSQDITGNIIVPNARDWGTYVNVSGTTPPLDSGQQILRIAITGSHCNIDWIQFSENTTPAIPTSGTGKKNIPSTFYNLLGRIIAPR